MWSDWPACAVGGRACPEAWTAGCTSVVPLPHTGAAGVPWRYFQLSLCQRGRPEEQYFCVQVCYGSADSREAGTEQCAGRRRRSNQRPRRSIWRSSVGRQIARRVALRRKTPAGPDNAQDTPEGRRGVSWCWRGGRVAERALSILDAAWRRLAASSAEMAFFPPG